MIRKVRTFLELPWRQKKIFLMFCCLIPGMELSIRSFGLRRTHRILERMGSRALRMEQEPEVVINRHKNLLDLFVKNFPFGGRCLAQSLSLWYLLKRLRVETDLKFGTKRDDGEIRAHAWLEYQGTPIDSQTEIYTSFPDSILTKIS
ncbi:MAG: lasso peptide biosynthesis B2 protein [Pyrinomonadaceae bacterium]|nr:lasso peptide biosynthesis B2 protein [Pyrinomonadaceae bacterium]